MIVELWEDTQVLAASGMQKLESFDNGGDPLADE